MFVFIAPSYTKTIRVRVRVSPIAFVIVYLDAFSFQEKRQKQMEEVERDQVSLFWLLWGYGIINFFVCHFSVPTLSFSLSLSLVAW